MVCLLLSLLMWPDPNRQVGATDAKKPLSLAQQETAPIVEQKQNDPEQPGHAEQASQNSPPNPSVNVVHPARTIVLEADAAASQVTSNKTGRTKAGSDQPAVAASSSGASPEANEFQQTVEVRLPAPFLPVPPTRKWSSDDLEAVASLAKEFNDSVMTSANFAGSPASPTYYRAWMTAAYLANEEYRSLFGFEAFNALRTPSY